jgi:thiopurine S-methyltransferase
LDRRFWEQRWAEGAIGFHRGAVSPALERYARSMFPPDSKILVPLCGKSHDLDWLAAHGFAVHGVEYVEQAVRAFFAERGLEPERVGDTWSVQGLAIQCASIFTADLDGPFGGIWDRAAMVALPLADRPAYVRRLRELVEGGAVLLLESFTYEAETMSGPPFPVAPDEVRASYAGLRLEMLQEEDMLRTEPRWRERGATSARSTTWAIRA